METLGVLVFLGFAILSLVLIAKTESKREKRIWEWRERLLCHLHEISLVIENKK